MSTRFFKLPGRGRKPGTEASAGALLTDRQHQLIEQELTLLSRLLDDLRAGARPDVHD